jgi:hypothetical protein
MTTHAMIDIETLGTDPDCVVLSVGAVKFDPFTLNEPHSNTLWRPSADEQLNADRSVDQGTIEWWGKQAPEIIEEAFSPDNRLPVSQVMDEFHKFAWGCDAFWAHGSIFDIVILETYYRKLGKPLPWNFWQIRDTRTIFDLGYDPEMPKDAKHNALEDAYRQAVGVQNMYKKVARQK